MLTLNSQSWFARKFLQIKFEHERPTNICSFIRRLLVATVVWALVGFMASLLVASYITTIYGLVVVLFTNTTFHDFFARDSYGGWPNLALAMCSTSMLILTVVGSLSAFFWIKRNISINLIMTPRKSIMHCIKHLMGLCTLHLSNRFVTPCEPSGHVFMTRHVHSSSGNKNLQNELT